VAFQLGLNTGRVANVTLCFLKLPAFDGTMWVHVFFLRVHKFATRIWQTLLLRVAVKAVCMSAIRRGGVSSEGKG
jgi:hypothetical protein